MTNAAVPDAFGGSSRSGLSIPTALRIAWLSWLGMLVLPFFVFLWAVWETGITTTEAVAGNATEARFWFLATSLYLLIAVPISFFWRGHVFKAYWTGNMVSPGKYLAGMLSIWIALEVGGICSLVGCVASHDLLPGLLPALTAFMFYVTFWPSGRAMTRPVGQHEDPQFYEEPR